MLNLMRDPLHHLLTERCTPRTQQNLRAFAVVDEQRKVALRNYLRNAAAELDPVSLNVRLAGRDDALTRTASIFEAIY